MMEHFENINLLWAWLIIDELVRNDINYFCISPGARSTPLTVAVARNPGARYIICNDERGAAYHALGFSKGCAKPAVVISTSGTAVANYFPAVVESSFDLVPFIILSADRPHELRATGANQTIQQTNIFGDYLRWQFDLPCPNENVAPEVVLTTVDQAIYRAILGPAGPVHLNCPFREPLAPISSVINPEYLNTLKNWLNKTKPYTLYSPSYTSLNNSDLTRLTALINGIEKGILVVGHLRTSQERESVQALSESLQWPLFADILSGIRLGNNHRYLIPNYDQLLLSEKFSSALQPEVVLQLGGQITSKRLLKYLEELAPEKYVLVTNHPFRFDPIHRVTWRIESSLSALYQNLKDTVINRLDKNWLGNLVHQSQLVKKVVKNLLCSDDTISEPGIAQVISKIIPQNHSLFLASSLPIREMDMFSDFSKYPIRVTANRGASGIDGIIASATGYARGLQQPVTLLIGDLALLHDLNSLMLVQSIPQPVIIVIFNNQGGGIFSFLPIAEFKDIFETFFGTPHPYTFEHAAKMFHLDYFAPENRSDFSKIYLDALGKKKSAIIEVRTDRDENFNFHKKIQDEVIKVMEKF